MMQFCLWVLFRCGWRTVLQSLFLIVRYDSFGGRTGVRTEEMWVFCWWLCLFPGFLFYQSVTVNLINSCSDDTTMSPLPCCPSWSAYLYPTNSGLAFPGLDLWIVREMDLFWLKRDKSDSWVCDIRDASLCHVSHFPCGDVSIGIWEG